jgi:hypothetical protein
MNFKIHIREEFEDLQVIFFIGGEGTRMKNLYYKYILPSKQWLIVGFDENGEPIPLWFKNFEILRRAGLKNFYFLASNDRCFEYFKERFGNNLEYNLQFFSKEDFLKIKSGEDRIIKENGKVNIYVIETGKKGNGVELLYLYKLGIIEPIFLRVYGDEYLEIKNTDEVKEFIRWGIKKVIEEDMVSAFMCVPREKVKNKDLEKRLIFNIGRNGELLQEENGNFIVTSFTLHSIKFIELVEQIGASSIEDERVMTHTFHKKVGKAIEVEFFVNVNTKKDYKILQDLLGISQRFSFGFDCNNNNKKNLKEKN